MESGVRNLGIHTEMLTDGIIDLYRAGVATGSAKTSHPGKIVCSFGLGSKKLYDTIAHNPDVSCQPVNLTNLPHVIMQNDRLTAINTRHRWISKAKRRVSRAVTVTSAVREVSSNSFARPTHRTAGSRSSACRRLTSAPACAAAASCWT